MERLINKDKLVDVLEHAGGGRNSQYVYRKVAEYVRAMPTVDAVEVVRCKDCKHGLMLTDVNGLHILLCGSPFAHGIAVDNYGFCKWGERREDVRESD